MAYKTRYRPIEMLGVGGWQRMPDAAAQPVSASVQRAIETELA
jgi:arginyl-tRNA--protein-N-Asp/Glu arginylyltransferase